MTVGRIPVIEGGIQPTIFDAKADLLTATANDTPARLAVGANGTMLVANSAESTGLKWTTATDQFPWQTYTSRVGNFTLGNGTGNFRYARIGNTVFVSINIDFGSTTSISGPPNFELPVTPKYGLNAFIGNYTDAGSAYYPGIAINEFGSYAYIVLKVPNTSGTYGTYTDVGSTTPFTWTTSDQINFQFSYEAA
jgi:hypothetical protein